MTEHVDLLSEPPAPLTLADLVANRQVPDSARPNVSLGEIRELAARSATPSSEEAEEEDGVDPDDYYAGPFNTAGGHEHWGDR